MSLFWIIFKREYLNIVKKRAFLLTTFLLPLGFLFIFGIELASILLKEKEEATIWILQEEMPILSAAMTSGNGISYKISDKSLDLLKKEIENKKNEYILKLPDTSLLQKQHLSLTIYHASGNVSAQIQSDIEKKITAAIHNYKREKSGISKQQLETLNFKLTTNTIKFTDKGSQESNTALASMIGYIMNFLMYLLLGIYGAILMQSVMEEKNNRIVEIIIASVDPYYLMMGKTVAVALAGLTQFLLWCICSIIVMGGATLLLPLLLGSHVPQPNISQVDAAATQNMANEVLQSLQHFNWSILWFFPFYFLGGFFLYGSLYAAVGSIIDNPQDAQQFSLPITFIMMMPLLFGTALLNSPNGVFATFCSIFPLFSPMCMMIRLSLTEVPWYEVVLSIILLISSFFGSIWVSAKIYRIGILMYGKKPSFKELFRWLIRSS